MSISLKHTFVSTLPDGPNPDHIQASHWNAEHTLTLSAGTILGNSAASTGSAEEISIGSGLSLSGGTLSATLLGNIDGGNASVVFGGTLLALDGGAA